MQGSSEHHPSGFSSGSMSEPDFSAFGHRFTVRGAFLLLFFFSGICGLIYEVVWGRMLALVMGSTVYASSTVLAAFMGGLALGSWLLGRLVDRYGRPLILYGFLELLLGLYCLILPFLLEAMVPLYRMIYQTFHPSLTFLTGFQFVFSGILLLIPTALMGGTLPVVSKSFVRGQDRIGSTAGRFYAVNTIGAVIGALGAGYYLMPRFGVHASIYGAAGLNILIGLLTFGLAWWLSVSDAPQAASRFLLRAGDYINREAWLVLLCFSVSGAAALIYEVAWTRSLSLLLGPSVQAFSLMLGAFITGLAVGSWIFSFWADRIRNPIVYFALLQWGVAFSAAAFMPLVNVLPAAIRDHLRTAGGSFTEIQFLTAAVSFAVMLIPTTCLGGMFPIVVRLYSRSIQVFGKRLGTLYAGNTVGAVAGSILAGFVLIPAIGLQKTILTAAILNGIIGGALLLISGIGRQWVRATLVVLPESALVLIVLLMPAWSRSDLVSGPYHYFYENEAMAQKILRNEKILFYREGVTGTVAVKERGDYRFLTISGKVDAGSREGDMTTQILSGHIPLLLARDPRDVLVIGLASGVTVGSVAQHPVRRIDVVEISREVAEALPFFSKFNHDPLSDPRVNLIIQDGRNHLLLSDRSYDVIISEPSNPWMAGVGNLYTREFFELARGRLRSGGVMAQWIQAYNLPLPLLKTVVKTFSSVFPNVSLWLAGPGDLVLIGSADPVPLDVNQLKERLDEPKVRSDLQRVGFRDWWQLVRLDVAEGSLLRREAADARLHTDDHPFLEYELPKFLHVYTTEENSAWIEGLMAKGSRPSVSRGSLVIDDEDLFILKLALETMSGN
jgi:spermidine synthase